MMQYELSDDEPELETLNISNDYYYLPISERTEQIKCEVPHAASLQIPRYGSKTIRHSLPAYDLWKAFFPTYLSETKFQNFHRPKLRHYNNGPQARDLYGYFNEHPIKNLTRNIFRSHMNLRTKVIQAINNRGTRDDVISKFLLIKHARELTAKDGELLLFEYCEEYPPILSQVGMASNVKTYSYEPCPTPNQLRGLKSQMISIPPQKETDETVVKNSIHGYVETIRAERPSKLIYYNGLKRGIQTKFIENNLYRAPIFEHQVPNCDFLVVRTRNNYYIRLVNTIYTVGQELPLTIVPPPTENHIQRFRCDLSNVYIHKLFKASDTGQPSVSLNKIMKLFPDYHRNTVLTRMKYQGAKPVRIENDVTVYKGESSYGALSTQELRKYMTPETYCINMAMLAARQRLRELNYTESMIFPDKGQIVRLEPEVLAAPWNTTKAVVSTMVNRSFLDLERHLIDPTGPAREGFSCVAWVKSPTEVEQAQQLKADRSMRSETPITFGKNPLSGKIVQEKVRRLAIYQKEAQLIAQIQSDVLSNKDALTSSDDDYDEIDEENENVINPSFSQQVDDLSKLVLGGKSIVELSYEKEEEERRQLLKDLHLNGSSKEKTTNQSPKKSDDLNLKVLKNKILKITRTYEHGGNKIQRTEVVRDPTVMALYVKMKGGSLATMIAENNSQGGDSLNNSSRKIDLTPRRASLGPDEMCRTDGIRLIISRKALEGHRSQTLRKRTNHSYREG